MSKQYKVITPNPDYHGKACGIQFNKGFAILSEFTINPDLGRTLEETAKMFLDDFGYQVIELESVEVKEKPLEPTVPPPQFLTPKPKAAPRPKKRIVSGNPKEVVEVEKV